MKIESSKRTIGVPVAIFSMLILAACEKGTEGPAVGTTPIDQLIESGKSPVETGSLSRGISPIAPTFTMGVTNVSDMPVSLINGTVVFFDEAGKILLDTVQKAGFTDISPIEPGSRIELQIMCSNDKAVSGKYILKEVAYEKMNPKFKEYGALTMKWENPGHDAALSAEKSR